MERRPQGQPVQLADERTDMSVMDTLMETYNYMPEPPDQEERERRTRQEPTP